MSFAHLHVHSVYSLLDGFSNIKKLVKRAKELGMPAVGLTDHGTMFGTIEFYQAAVKAGVKPIIGVEAYMAARTMRDRDPQKDKKSSHLLLLAENETGYKNLLQLCSLAQLEGFYYYPRLDHETLAEYSEGLICTTGCMSAEIPRALQRENLDMAVEKFDYYYDVFGPDRFFVELQHHDIDEIPALNKALIDLNDRYNVGFVATNDVHYVDPEDARLQDILLAIQTGCVLTDPNRMRMSGQDYYLRSPQEMGELFGHIPGAIDNTLLIAERCELDLDFDGYKLPNFDVPGGHTAETYLRELCEEGLRKRYREKADDEKVRIRLDYELQIIHEMGFDTYFLIVWDLCQYAQRRNIWYNARGSAAGSIVAYCLEITMVDPIEHGLIFERFLNPGRISMPDIDLDFRDDMRAEMMDYCAKRYGHDRVAQIITFGTLKARAAVRDVGRVLDIPLNEVDRVAKMIPAIPGKPVSIEQAIQEVPELKELYKSADYIEELLDTAKELEGVVRNAGTHAAGVIVTDKPITEYVPLHRPTSNAAEELPIQSVTQYEMSIVDELGLLKIDFLGLITLTVMARACDFIRERYGIDYNLYNIPLDDPKSFELLGRGDTAGVFQVEGAGMRRNLMMMKPQNLDHVVAMIALYRPGPLEFIPTYIHRMHGEEEVAYRHPALESIFKETYGIPVYQEQLMRAAVELAGYTPQEADDLRKAIAKKIKAKLMKHRDKFVVGAVERGITEGDANQIFDDWEEFARYGFNKAHATDYGVIAVQTAYLKAHYPVEYMTALLSATKSDTDKVALYVADCRRMGLEVLPPSVNTSGWDFTIEDLEDDTSAIRFGMGAVKNVGYGPVEAIIQGRGEGDRFGDLSDFARRVDLRLVGKRALECLIKVGALDRYGSRPALLETLDQIFAISASHFKAAEVGQMSLFGAQTGIVSTINLPEIETEDSMLGRREQLNWERELIGLYVSDHPLSPYMDQLTQIVSHFAGELSEVAHRDRVRVAGLLSRIRRHITKTGKPMAFATIEDIQGNIDLVIFPRTWKNFGDLLQLESVILVEGVVDAEGGEPKVLVDKISRELDILAPFEDYGTLSSIKEGDRRNEKANGNEVLGEDSKGEQDPGPVLESINEKAPETKVSEMSDTYPANESNPPQGDHDEDSALSLPPPPEAFPRGWADDLDPEDISESDMEEISSKPLQQVSMPAALESHGELDANTEVGSLNSGDQKGIEGEESLEIDDNPEEAKSPAVKDSSLQQRFITSSGGEQEGDQPRMITVILRDNGDKVRDSLKIQRAYGILISYPGRDRFAFYLFEKSKSFLLEFPNFNTRICDEMIERLKHAVGEENFRIEPIIYQ